jgi:hypothetical protein
MGSRSAFEGMAMNEQTIAPVGNKLLILIQFSNSGISVTKMGNVIRYLLIFRKSRDAAD